MPEAARSKAPHASDGSALTSPRGPQPRSRSHRSSGGVSREVRALLRSQEQLGAAKQAQHATRQATLAAKRQLGTVEARMEKLEKLLEELSDQVGSLAANCGELQAAVNSRDATIADLQQHIAELQQQLQQQSATQETELPEQEAKSIGTALQQAIDDMSGLRSQVSALQDRVTAAEQRWDTDCPAREARQAALETLAEEDAPCAHAAQHAERPWTEVVGKRRGQQPKQQEGSQEEEQQPRPQQPAAAATRPVATAVRTGVPRQFKLTPSARGAQVPAAALQSSYQTIRKYLAAAGVAVTFNNAHAAGKPRGSKPPIFFEVASDSEAVLLLPMLGKAVQLPDWGEWRLGQQLPADEYKRMRALWSTHTAALEAGKAAGKRVVFTDQHTKVWLAPAGSKGRPAGAELVGTHSA